ncbi:MAG TPA: class I SAM-dependent methyltransferase, partial [Ktedonobacteraceae bacterium]|nr:class I SAM-dependent methyltransferase [Ktedonobacteraceae bacterium]
MTEQQNTNVQHTYFFDPESASEMARLIEQDRMMTKAMGGPLAGLPDLPLGAQVLDLACGPGSWALDTAYASPDSEIAGVDISRIMIDYANARARSQGLTNVSFGVMDITQPLDFSDHSFDLVNARTLFAVLRRDAWQPFISECTRILKAGGTLRLNEPVDGGVTNSAAIERLLAALARAIWTLGYGFSIDGRSFGIVPSLPALLREAGY